MRARRPASTTSKPSPTNLAWPASTIGTPPAATYSPDSDVTPPPHRPTGGPANSPRHPPRSPTSPRAPRSTPLPAEQVRGEVFTARPGRMGSGRVGHRLDDQVHRPADHALLLRHAQARHQPSGPGMPL